MRHRDLRAMLALLVTVLAACGGSSSATSKTATNADPNATFNYFMAGPIDSMDPPKTNITNAGIWMSPVLDTLVAGKPNGSYGPKLATAWSLADNGLTLQMTLRHGVKFQDGTPFNAQAVKANIERDKTLPKSFLAPQLANVSLVQVVDDNTVKLELAGGGGTILSYLADTAGRMVSPADFNNPDIARLPIGTGPFKIVSNTPSGLTYERNPTYWGSKPSYPRLVVNIISTQPTTRVAALQAGQLDAIFVSGFRPAQVDQLRALPDIKVEKVSPYVGWYINFNKGGPWFGNALVRQAVSYAIDRAQIARTFGVDPTQEPALTGSRYVNQKYNGYYAYDPTKAKQLLTEAGFPNGFDMGDLSTVASWSEYAQVVQSELAAVGIKSAIRVFDSSVSLNATCWVQQKCSMFAGAFIQRADPTRVAEDNILPDALTNMGHSTPPETLRKLKLAEAGTSDTEHVSRVTDLMGQIVVDAPDLFVANVTTYVVYHMKVQNVTASWDNSGFPDYGQVVISK